MGMTGEPDGSGRHARQPVVMPVNAAQPRSRQNRPRCAARLRRKPKMRTLDRADFRTTLKRKKLYGRPKKTFSEQI